MFRALVDNRLNLLLAAAPVSWMLAVMAPGSPWIFITAAVSLIPLAGLIGLGTEQLARRSGPGWGGFLNATFGNAAELIIALVALNKGHVELVKASITGSIVGNLLLVLGLSFFVGGLGRRSVRSGQRTAADDGCRIAVPTRTRRCRARPRRRLWRRLCDRADRRPTPPWFGRWHRPQPADDRGCRTGASP